MKILISKSTQFPVNQEESIKYQNKWKEEFDKQFKVITDKINEDNTVKLSKASKDKRLKNKAKKVVNKLYLEFNKIMEDYKVSLDKEFNETFELSIDSKDFNIEEFFKEHRGIHRIGLEKNSENLLLVLDE